MTAMAHEHDSVYVQGSFSEPMSAQHNFSDQFDLDQPQLSMARYNRIMHEHTKQQLEQFTGDVQRRSSDAPASLSNESSIHSVSSTDS